MDYFGNSKVHYACDASCISELTVLLEENSELAFAQNDEGCIPLHFAKTVEVAELLISSGCRNSQSTKFDMLKIINSHKQNVALIFSSHCNAALITWCFKGLSLSEKATLCKSVDINGNSSLHVAASEEVLLELIRVPSDISSDNANCKFEYLKEIIVQCPLNFNRENILHIATRAGWRLVLEHVANIVTLSDLDLISCFNAVNKFQECLVNICNEDIACWLLMLKTSGDSNSWLINNCTLNFCFVLHHCIRSKWMTAVELILKNRYIGPDSDKLDVNILNGRGAHVIHEVDSLDMLQLILKFIPVIIPKPKSIPGGTGFSRCKCRLQRAECPRDQARCRPVRDH